MDTWQIAEKIFNFCEGKYPDLKWVWSYSYSDIDSCRVVALISGSCSLFKLEIEVCSNEKDEFYEKEATYDYILGSLLIPQSEEKSLLFWSSNFKVELNHDKDSSIDFTLYETGKMWNEKDWVLSKQARKIMLGIFNFIANEIQE